MLYKGGTCMNNRIFELTGDWYIAKDEGNVGIDEKWESAVRSDAVEAYVPSIIQQFFPNYHGLAYYWCKFAPSLDTNVGRVLLKFGGVDYKASVWLNGKYLGEYEGGETPFDFDVTDALAEGENLLAVRVLNPCDREIDGLNLLNTPHRNKVVKRSAGSNLNHGGIWYGVYLEAVPSAYMNDVFLIPEYESGDVKAKIEVDSTVDACGTLEITARDCAYSSGYCVREVVDVRLFAGSNRLDLCVNIPNHKLWDVDSPNLYAVEMTLRTPCGEHRVTNRIGFREFHVEDGFFYLNGKRIYLKSSHTGNAFPIGEMFPVRPDHVRKDMNYAKSCGFNMLRFISGMARPEQLDYADEIGMLVYEECFASWCLGNSQMLDWNDEEGYKIANEKFPEMPLGDEGAMLERWRGATDKMILRDRNHACVVVWGLLNETRNNSVFRAAVDYLPRARELDPTRFVVLNGGRFDYDLTIGSASNPYAKEWENTWWNDGNPESIRYAVENKLNKNWFVGDNHHYPTSPLSDKDAKIFRSFAKDGKALFMSETGIGPLFNVIDEYRHFKQYGERLDLEDSSWLEYQSKCLERDFERLGLNKIYPFPELMLRESQKNSAVDRRLMFDAIRSNPKISGYSLTGLLDHGMCGEGLWSYWRHWKKDVFDAVTEGWEPLRFCLFVPCNVYSGDSVPVEVVLANEGVLKSGEYTASVAIVGDRGCEYVERIKFELDDSLFAVPVYNGSISVDLPRGNYKVVVELDDGAPRASEIDFRVFDRRDNYVGNTEIFGLGLNDKTKEYLEGIGVAVKQWDGESNGTLLVDSAESADVKSAIDAAEKGLSVFFLSKDTFLDTKPENMGEARRVIADLNRKYYHDWLYHKECVLADREIFDGFNCGLAVLREFEGVFPGHIYRTEITPDYVVCPAFQTGYFAVEDAYMLAYAMLGQNFGKGRVFFNSLEIRNKIGSPVADKLLSNVIKYLTK